MLAAIPNLVEAMAIVAVLLKSIAIKQQEDYVPAKMLQSVLRAMLLHLQFRSQTRNWQPTPHSCHMRNMLQQLSILKILVIIVY